MQKSEIKQNQALLGNLIYKSEMKQDSDSLNSVKPAICLLEICASGNKNGDCTHGCHQIANTEIQ